MIIAKHLYFDFLVTERVNTLLTVLLIEVLYCVNSILTYILHIMEYIANLVSVGIRNTRELSTI